MTIMLNKLKKLYKLLPPLILRDIHERYAGSVIGILWTFLQPLLFIAVYWLVFSEILRIRIHTDTGEIPFIVFLLSGLLPWFALQEGVLRGTSSIIDKRNVIKKVIFPSELFPLSSVLSAFIHHALGFLIFLIGFFVWRGEVSMFQIASILAILLLQILLASGLALLFSSLCVYLRDIAHILNIGFQVLFYISTILYPLTAVPEKLRTFVFLNPVTSLAESYHNIILYNRHPEIEHLSYLLVITTASVIAGVYTFRKLKKGFSDVL